MRFARNDYSFNTTWRVAATIQDVADLLQDVESLPHWWGRVYLQTEVLDPGDASGVGKRVQLVTKGFLPYRLRWTFTVTESDSPNRFVLAAQGDFVGRGEWTLTQEGPIAKVQYEWRVRAEKPFLRALTPFLKPLFALNHRWAMREGEAALKRELARMRRSSSAERVLVRH